MILHIVESKFIKFTDYAKKKIINFIQYSECEDLPLSSVIDDHAQQAKGREKSSGEQGSQGSDRRTVGI